VLLDISMPGSDIAAARRIAAACLAVRIIMLTVSENEIDVMDALKVGACGYVLKGISGEELAEVIDTIHEGGVYVSPNLAARMLVYIKGARSSDLFSDLTAREEQILKHVVKGHSNKEIDQALNLSEKTVKHYKTNVFQKLQVRNRVEAAIKARDHYSAN
jgi:DNA-binding NarL/FixJ family response regulator